MLFDFIYGLRKTKQNIKQLSLLAMCLSVVISAFVIVMALGELVLADRPKWFEQNSTFFTMGKSSDNGTLMPVAKRDLNLLVEQDTVLAAGSVVLLSTPLQMSDTPQQHNASLAMFSEPLLAFLQPSIREIFNANTQHASVWVTDSFWRKNQQTLPKLGEVVYLGEKKVAYTLAGVLPKDMNRLGSQSIDFWLNDSHYLQFINISLQLPPGMAEQDVANILADAKKEISLRVENRYIVLSTEPNADPVKILSTFSEAQNQAQGSTQFQMLGGGLEYQLIPGVEFAPQVKVKLSQQWWVLLFFILGFALVTFFNLISFISGQLVHRQQELTIRMVCGSHLHALLKQFSLEALPFLALTSVITFSALAAIYSKLAQSEELINVIGVALPTPSVVVVCIAIIVLLLFAFGAFLAPCLNSFKQSLFIRQVGEGETKAQVRMQTLIAASQMAVAGLSLFFVGLFLQQQWLQRDISGLDVQNTEYSIKLKGALSVTSGMVNATLQGDAKLAFSASSFIDPDTSYQDIEVVGSGPNESRRLHTLPVSDNYFSILKAEFIHYGKIDEHSVMINQAAFNALGLNGKTNLDTIRVKFMGKTYRIAGVVTNFPHFGQHNRNVPFLYVHYKAHSPFLSGHFIRSHSAAMFESASTTVVLEPQGSLELQIKQFDAQRLWFIALSIGLLLVLLCATIVTLYFHSNARIKKDFVRFGTFQALGVPDQHLFMYCVALFKVPYLVAVITTVFMFMIGLKLMYWQANAVWFVIVAVGLLTLLSSLLALRGFRTVTKRPIVNLLKPS